MSSVGDDKLDIVIFGATGFTGKYAVLETIKLSKDKGGFSWGVAGRNQEKLQEVIRDAETKSGEDLSKVRIIVADLKDERSLLSMAAQARVVANCAGPYRLYGEPVVKACITSGTHHVDVSGEPHYMERIQLEYHKAAEEKEVYVVSACGFDSIPADLGTVFLEDNFEGSVNSVETYVECWTSEGGKAEIHYGTWESVIYGLAHSKELRPLRQKLFPNRLPALSPKLKPRSIIHRNEFVQGWCLPFPGADRAVIQRSQRYFYEHERKRPIQVQAYVAVQSLLTVVAILAVGAVFALLAHFRAGRQLLLRFPWFFSAGTISHEGPSEESANNTFFSVSVCGEGWKEKLAEPTDQHTQSINKKMVVKVSGRNPGYGATSTMLMMSAFIILSESSKMPGRGGVYTPGAAFGKTSMVKNLNDRGIKFQAISKL